MHKDIIKVYVDKKELEMKKKTMAFFNMKKIPTEERLLGDFGDVALLLTCKQYLNIERKTFQDFTTSYISGHLQDQAFRMNKACANYCVIVYGNINDLKYLGYKYPAVKHIKQSSINKMVMTMEMVYKCPVFFVDNEQQYFQKIMELAENINKHNGETLQNKSVATLKNRPDVDIIMLINKIGQKTALSLLKEFKTPEKVLNASRQELKQVNDVGDATVANIKDFRKVFYEGL